MTAAIIPCSPVPKKSDLKLLRQYTTSTDIIADDSTAPSLTIN